MRRFGRLIWTTAAATAMAVGCRTAPDKAGAPGDAAGDAIEAADSGAPSDEKSRRRRRKKILGETGADDPFRDLYREDEFDGARLSGLAIDAFGAGQDHKAILLAQAALGADPGNGSRRKLVEMIEKKTGLRHDPEGVLHLNALVHYELKRADEAFFKERFGSAVRYCRRALMLAPNSGPALRKLGSAHYALGEKNKARAAYERALALDPGDPRLRRFLVERGWMQK